MYLDFFQLKDQPFRLTPDASFLYLSPGHRRAKAYLDYTVMSRDGFVIVTGEVGSGKTTLLNRLLSEIPADLVVAKVFQTQLDDVDFLRAMLSELGHELYDAGKAELLNAVKSRLYENYHKGRRTLLIVDEAQNLSDKVLEEIRLLSGLETDTEKLLSLIVVGQPELNARINAPHLEQLLQRVRLRFHLGRLSEEETGDYIRHRLKVAGAQRADLFDPETIPIIQEYTGGTPRLINTLCEMALLCSYLDGWPAVIPETTRAAVEELGWGPFSERHRLQVTTDDAPDECEGPEVGGQLRAEVTRLYDAMPRFSAGIMGRLRLIEGHLRTISSELKKR